MNNNATQSKTKVNPFKFRELSVFAVIILIFIIAIIIEPRFISFQNIINILLYFPLILTVALGQMISIIIRNIDISVGSILGFSGISVAMIFVKYPNFPVFLAFLAGAVIGGFLGLFNGFLVTRFKLPSIIVTLGTLNLYRGLLFIICQSQQIDQKYIPKALIHLSQPTHSPVKIPWIVIFSFVLALIVYLFLKHTYIGREIYAYGSNPSASELRGINTNYIVILVFIITGTLSGLAGVMYASRMGYVNPSMTGIGMEFVVIAAAVIGGTSMGGGIGTVLGTIAGCFLLGEINVALPMLKISGFWQQAIYGIIIILAVISDKFIQTKLTNNN